MFADAKMLRREDTLDVEVAASGFTKEMDFDLMNEVSDEEEAEEEERREEAEEAIHSADSDEDYQSCEEEVAEEEPRRVEEPEDPIPLTDETSCHYSSDESYAPSYRSYSTASTIAPEVIRERVKKALANRQRKEQRKRLVAKGEASATTRSRRENRLTIKECDGIWGWED
ncbi:UNVERIFIED_CONTAM: hypothetical protein PYX00_003086 [Menopon gallinae]|uniref:Uncharacterized protein n=1 Tax=Menopon gallinae TaxID=328185 RepID=A0AAW2I034_9NEOP